MQETKMDKQVIKKASGYFLPGMTNYIMGSSGAGKTSLLNILAGRVQADKNKTITGDVKFN